MIKSVTISNFESHKETIIKFLKGINFIVGQSDSGKSTILRALNWVINNRPGGDDFRSHWGGDTAVALKIKNKQVVRGKTKVGNVYTITGIKDPLRSFGQTVPDDIQKALNFSSLNIVEQISSPFLLTMSGGEVAKYLNNIAQLSKIDSAQSNINKTLRDEQHDLASTKLELKQAEEDLAEYDWVDEAEGKLVELEALQTSIFRKNSRRQSLQGYLNSLEAIDKQIAEVKEITQYEGEVNKLIKKRKKLNTKIKRKQVLANMLTSISVYDVKIYELEFNLEVWQKQFDELMPDTCPLCGRSR